MEQTVQTFQFLQFLPARVLFNLPPSVVSISVCLISIYVDSCGPNPFRRHAAISEHHLLLGCGHQVSICRPSRHAKHWVIAFRVKYVHYAPSITRLFSVCESLNHKSNKM